MGLHVSVVQCAIADGIGRITLNRPERMNAVTTELARQLEHALSELSSDPAVNVIVIRGAGKNFCAGGDVAEVERLRSAGPESLRTLFDAFRRACDAIGSDDAKIADNHINFGMLPGGGSTQRLPRLVGRQLALGLLLSGDRLSGLDAVRLGLAYRSFAPQDFDEGVN